MDIIDTNDLRAARHRDHKMVIYRWQTKGFFTAQKIWARYYLPKPRGATPTDLAEGDKD